MTHSSEVVTRLVIDGLFDASAHVSRPGWEPFREGIDILRLYGDGESGAAAALLSYAPGAVVPRHLHPGYEHIVVLSGSQSDEDGTYGPGACVIHGPGSRHSVRSDEGCVVLAIWAQPVVFETG